MLLSAAATGVSVLRSTSNGRAAFADARAALLRPDSGAARSAFDRALDHFASADRTLRSWTALPLRVLPIVRTQVSAIDKIARASAAAARAGRVATGALDAAPPEGWGLVHGRIDLGAAMRAKAILADAATLATGSLAELESARGGWLAGPVASALEEADTRLGGAVDGLTKARDGLGALPSLLGAGGVRRYVVAFANRSELRGTGGFIGFLTMVEAKDGRLTVLEHSGRPTESLPPPSAVQLTVPDWFVRSHGQTYGATSLWQNINTSVDFPTVGSAIAQVASRAVGQIDGVIQIDAAGIAALLDMSGPATVPLWDGAITSDNVADVTEHDMYVTYPDRRVRTELINQLVTTVFQQVLRGTLALNAATLRALGGTAGAGDMQAFSVHESDERVLRTLGVAGSVDRASGATDVLDVVTENSAANKADWFLRRQVTYRVALDPNDRSAHADLTADISNKAPTKGEPQYVIGPNISQLRAGDNRQIVLILRPPSDELNSIDIDGAQSAVRARESNLRAYHSGVTIASGADARVLARFTVPDALRGRGNERFYRLHVLRQPVAFSDFYDVRIRAPAGWDIEGTKQFVGTLENDVVLDVRLHRTLRGRVVDALFAGPWRAARSLF